MIDRKASNRLRHLAQSFKVVAVIGPRQSGKTTLVKAVFPHLPYISLENPDVRRFALEDPRGFLSTYNQGAVFDEAQRVPELFSYLQQIVDESPTTGRFILTGSHNFLLQQSISQSLAGRVAYQELMPFDFSEIGMNEASDCDAAMLKGGYPPLFDQPVTVEDWFSNYIRTYIERDVRQIRGITDLIKFDRFVRLCAGRIGQLDITEIFHPSPIGALGLLVELHPHQLLHHILEPMAGAIGAAQAAADLGAEDRVHRNRQIFSQGRHIEAGEMEHLFDRMIFHQGLEPGG